MGWYGPRDGYRDLEHAIEGELRGCEIEARHFAGPGCGWVLISGSSTQDGQPLIVCVLLDQGMAKLIDTTSGPFHYGCPLEWLERVPVREAWDREWRARNLEAARVH